MVGFVGPDGPIPAVVTVLVLGVVYVAVLVAWALGRAARWGVTHVSRQVARLGRWLPGPLRPA